MRIYFSVICESIFSIVGKLVFDFFVICEICIYLHVIFKPMTFAGTIFHFLRFGRDLSLLNMPKLLDVEPEN